MSVEGDLQLLPPLQMGCELGLFCRGRLAEIVGGRGEHVLFEAADRSLDLASREGCQISPLRYWGCVALVSHVQA